MRVGTLVGIVLVLARLSVAQPISQRISAADTGLLFGGADAEGGVGDWYVTNGRVRAIVDDTGVAADLVGIVPAGSEPPIQSEISPTGGTLIDLGLAGRDGDELSQLITVGGLSTSNFILYDSVSAPVPGTVRATGKLLLPPVSDRPAPCIGIVTDYTAAGDDPFLTLTTTATNGCPGALASGTLGGFLDAIAWTQRGIIPFSAGGRGFDHPVLDLANPISALEFPTFVAAPGMLRAADGVMDPANGTSSSGIAYGLLPVSVEVDVDGPGGGAPTITPANVFFGISSPLVTAVGAPPVDAPLEPGGTITYVRRVYVGAGSDVAAAADVRAVGDLIIPELAMRMGFATGTLAGDLGAADTPDVDASVLVRRVGRCAGGVEPCEAAADCGGGACTDPVPTTGFGPGAGVTQIRSDASGAFSAVVPVGDYELTVSAPEREDVVAHATVTASAETTVAVPPLSARGTVAFTVREKAKGRPTIPAKLVFKGVDPTPDPRFHRDVSATLGDVDVQAETFGGTQRGVDGSARGQGNVVYTATGSGSIAIRPGTYDVYAARGPEYGVMRRRITVTSGAVATADFRVKRVIRTSDALSADFHVHSGRSLDSSAPLEDRVVSFVAEGVDVMVSTDHDKQVDYVPVIAALGLGARIAALAGDELTGSVPNPPAFPNSYGHINAWPLPVVAGEPRDGAVADEFVAPNWLFSRLRAKGGAAAVIQYNHPRAGVSGLTNIGFFNSIGCNRCSNAIDTACTDDAGCPGGECTCVGYQPDRPITMPPNDVLLDTGVLGPGSTPNPQGIRNIDFDVMEVANGAKAGDFVAYRQVRDDWFSLLAQDFIRPGTGVSDSHRITVEHAGWARTYVLGTGDDPTALDLARFDANVKAGRMVVSAGPYLSVVATTRGAKAGPGDTIAVTKKLRLRIDVRSPAWIPVEEVRVVTIDTAGTTVRAFDASTRPRVRPTPKNFQSSGGTARLRASVPIRLASDGLVLVEAGAKLPADPATPPASPEIVDVVEPEVVPLAFTNPIKVDLGGDGYAAPGIAAAVRTSGRMTGVTHVHRAAAIARGEHFPIHAFRLAPADVAQARARVGK